MGMEPLFNVHCDVKLEVIHHGGVLHARRVIDPYLEFEMIDVVVAA